MSVTVVGPWQRVTLRWGTQHHRPGAREAGRAGDVPHPNNNPVNAKQLIYNWRTQSHVLFWGHWYPCFRLWTSHLGFKPRVDSALFAFAEANLMYSALDPSIVTHIANHLTVSIVRQKFKRTLLSTSPPASTPPKPWLRFEAQPRAHILNCV